MQIIIALLLVTLLNIVVTQARIWHTAVRDARRLQTALRTEAGELVKLIEANLERLRSGAPHLLSLRACTFVYRGNVQRLGLIPDQAIAPLVSAYAIVEQAEHLVAATTKPYGQLAFRIIADETPLDAIVAELERAQAAVQRVFSTLPGRPEAVAVLVAEAPPVADPLRTDRVAGRT